MLFLLYSVEHGWLQPPVRVAIGVILSVTLLVVCERKAARKYVATANAMDGSAIAILFSTGVRRARAVESAAGDANVPVAGVVTALAVVISLRHDSLFTRCWGSSAGSSRLRSSRRAKTVRSRCSRIWSAQRRPGVGGVSQRWPLLTVLSTLLTAIYQWGWVLKFLDESSLLAGHGIFLLFQS